MDIPHIEEDRSCMLEVAQKKINNAIKEIEHMQNGTGNLCCHGVMEILEQILAPERFAVRHVRIVERKRVEIVTKERIKPDIDAI
jgi:hypothetical protein